VSTDTNSPKATYAAAGVSIAAGEEAVKKSEEKITSGTTLLGQLNAGQQSDRKVKIVIDHLGKPDLNAPDAWADFRKMYKLKRFSQVWVSASEPYELSLTKQYPYRDTFPFFKAVYDEFGPKQLIWGTGYPKPRWELPMDKELDFVEKQLDFYTAEDRRLILGENALRIWKFPK